MSFVYDMYTGKIQVHANTDFVDLRVGGWGVGALLYKIFLFTICLIGDIIVSTQIFKKEHHQPRKQILG